MILLVLAYLLTVRSEKLLQLSDEHTALEFPTHFSAPVVVQPHAGFCLAAGRDFSVSAWLKLEVLNPARVAFLTVSSGNQTVIRVFKDQENSVLAEVHLESGDVQTVEIDGARPQVWELISISLKSRSTFTLCSAPWKGVPACRETSTSDQSFLIETHAAVVHLGAAASGYSIQGQILDARLGIGYAVDELAVEDAVASADCAPSCTAGCWGPGHRSCTHFIPLVTANDPVSSNSRVWAYQHPFLQGMKFDSYESGISGWIYEDAESLATYFTAKDPSHSPVFSLKRTKTRAFQACIRTSTNDSLCASSFSTVFQPRKWYFLAAWVAYSAGNRELRNTALHELQTVNLCWGAWEKSLDCRKQEIKGVPTKWDGSVASFAVGGFQGEAVNFNLYKSALTQATAENLFKSQRCSIGCEVCVSPFTCSKCAPGYSNIDGTCIGSLCSDFYIFHQQSVGKNGVQKHPVYLYEPFHKYTVVFVRRSGNLIWEVDWGEIPILKTTERGTKWLTVKEAHPQIPLSFTPGSSVSISVTGSGTYSLYLIVSWPHTSIQATPAAPETADSASLYDGETTMQRPGRHEGLKDTAVLRAWGQEYRLVEIEELLSGMILTSKLGGGDDSKVYSVNIEDTRELTITLSACSGDAALIVTQPSDPLFRPVYSGTAASATVPSAHGHYQVAVFGPQATDFELRLSSPADEDLFSGLFDPIWWEPLPDPTTVQVMWRPIRWVDGTEIAGSVTYMVSVEGSGMDICRICGFEVETTTVTLQVPLHDDVEVTVFAVLPTQLGSTAVPYATTHVRYIPPSPTPFVTALAFITTTGLLIGLWALFMKEKDEEVSRNYRLLQELET